MSINKLPSAFLLMDTCCFVHYCHHKTNSKFDYNQIRIFVNDNDLWVVITPYTLFELVQNCTTPDIVGRVRDELLSAGEFWVINVNELIGDNKTFEYGYDFLFEFGFNDPKNSEHFKDKLNEWRGKVYTSLAPRISLLTQMLAIIYVQLIDTRGEHDALTEGTVWKCRFIDNEFANNDAITRLLDFYLYQHPKEDLVDFVDGLIKQMIAMANVYLLQAAENKFNSLAELNDEIIRENERIKDLYPRKEMAKRFKLLNKRINRKLNTDSLVDIWLGNQDPFFRGVFKHILNRWFSGNYSGKDMANTIIDFANMGIAKEAENMLPIIYITEETPFVKRIQTMDDACYKLSKDFYQEFYGK